jgi:hypothetical protein
MPSMPVYFVGKGRQFRLLDELFGGSGFQTAYTNALNRLNQQPQLAALAQRHAAGSPGPPGAGLTDSDAHHFAQHWLVDWWPGKHAEEVLRAGFREAISHAQSVNKPMEAIWVCADEDQFQVYFNEGPNQVTVIVFTPPPPKRPPIIGKRQHDYNKLTEDDPIWVVKVKDSDDDSYNADPHPDDRPLDPANQIILRRVRYEAPPGGNYAP